MQHRIGWAMLEPLNGSQAIALPQQGQGPEDHGALAAQGFKEGAPVGAEGLVTCGAVVAPFDVTVDPDVARFDLAKVGALFMITPLPMGFHDASPPAIHQLYR